MSEKFQNKYRIESTRLQSWNYGWNASYFVTICTKDKECFFGNIETSVNGISEIKLSEIGRIANKFWLEIPQHFEFVKLRNHIVMPNHVHGIIIIDKPDDLDIEHHVETRLIASLQTGGFAGNKNPMLNKNLSRIIRWYKGRTSFESRKTDPGFHWQSRFHDHIIRNEKSFDTISEYIINNPSKWTEDKFFKG